MFQINSNFIGNFKLGDNINYNLEILRELYSCAEKNKDKEYLFYKPITLIIISIIEAILYDFLYKIKNFTKERVMGIPLEIYVEIYYILKRKKIDKFSKYISLAKEHNLFDNTDPQIFCDLETLRKMRNLIHIQNENKDPEKNEEKVFTKERKILAEKTLEEIIKIMVQKYNRNNSAAQGHVEDFTFPWDPHVFEKENF